MIFFFMFVKILVSETPPRQRSRNKTMGQRTAFKNVKNLYRKGIKSSEMTTEKQLKREKTTA